MCWEQNNVFKHTFIIGTDTGVGKTHVILEFAQKFLQQGRKVSILKPVATGCVLKNNQLYSEDRLRYESMRSIFYDANLSIYENWSFKEPVSPHIAARLNNVNLDANAIALWCEQTIKYSPDIVLIEGAGGLLVPLNINETWIDVLKLLQVPIILVVGMRLGCLNHALLTANVLLANKLPFAGWIANMLDPNCLYPELLIETLKHKIEAQCLGIMPIQSNNSPCAAQY